MTLPYITSPNVTLPYLILPCFQYNKQFADATAASTSASASYRSGLGPNPNSKAVLQTNSGSSSSSAFRSNADVMAAVVGEVEAALRSLERERNTDTVSG